MVSNGDNKDPKDTWVLDSGCSFHMCPYKEWFQELNEGEAGYVLLEITRSARLWGLVQYL